MAWVNAKCDTQRGNETIKRCFFGQRVNQRTEKIKYKHS